MCLLIISYEHLGSKDDELSRAMWVYDGGGIVESTNWRYDDQMEGYR
jgi:hypothetical protein